MLCPYDLSSPGGVQGQALGLASSLRRAGHRVTLVAPDRSEPSGTWRGDLLVAGHPVGLRANGSVAPVALSPQAARRAAEAAAEADVVHLHEPFAPVLGYGCLVRGRTPMVGTFHRAGGGGLYRALSPLARWAAGRLGVRCCVSEAARATLAQAIGHLEVEVLFNGVEAERFAAAEPWPAEGPTVLFVGRHEPRKGLAVLLEAVEQLDPAPTVWIAGRGPETPTLQARYPAGPRRAWLGVVDDEQLARRLAGADVLCAPSLGGESFGVVLLEAMAAGTAVVASDLEGYRAAAAGHARLVPAGDPAALAVALAGALAEVGTPAGQARRSAASAHAQGWSMDHLAERYVGHYRRLVAARPRPGAEVA